MKCIIDINKAQKLQRTRLTNLTIYKLKTFIYKKVLKIKSKDKIRETFKSQLGIDFSNTQRKRKT